MKKINKIKPDNIKMSQTFLVFLRISYFEKSKLNRIMKTIFIYALLFFPVIGIVQAQNIKVGGRAIDAETGKALIGATVQLIDGKDKTVAHAFTNENGFFVLRNITKGDYLLKITYVGYKDFTKKLKIKGKKEFIKLGKLKVNRKDVKLDEVEVSGQSVIGEQRGDTTQFNASSFKTTKDATVEELIRKMPGVEVQPDGKVKAQGEEVKKVFVDGKQFFGDDPSIALKNLPAEIVDKVQIYDKASDHAEFTGFDDGERSKTMNIITKRMMRHGEFGKFSAAGGYEKKYQLNLNYNNFDGPRRISVLGMSNNVNQQNFSLLDILDMMGSRRGRMLRRYVSSGAAAAIQSRVNYAVRRTGASTFYGGLQDGISTTHAIGTNYTDMWADNLEITASYFFNYGDNENDMLTNRDYLFSRDSTKYYNENDDANSINVNHRFNMKLDWDLDTNTSLMWRPYATVQINKSFSNAIANTELLSGATSNASITEYNSRYTGYDLASILLFKHRFGEVGRTISFDLTGGLNNRDGSYSLLNDNFYNRDGIIYRDTINQKSLSPQDGYKLSGTFAYTEPVHKGGQLMLSYKASVQRNSFDQRTYNYNALIGDYDLLDSLTSNIFDNDYLYQKGGLAYRYKTKELYITAGLDYQVASLQNKQIFPDIDNIDYKFYNFLPSLRIRYGKSRTNSIYFRFRTSTMSPSVVQLQNLVDNSNPLQLSTGNPALKQQLTNSLFMRYSNFSSDFTRTFFAFISLSNTWDYIGTSSLLAAKDTMITPTLIVPAGAQLTMPVNLDGYWRAFSMINYGFPLGFMRSKFNISLNMSYVRQPGIVNGVNNYANMYSYGVMGLLTSNISENIDFNLTSRISFNNTINTVQQDNNLNYYNWMNIANIKWIVFEGFFVQADVQNVTNGGEYQPDNGNYTLLNFSIGKKFLDNDAAEVKLYVFDILNMNKSIQTNLTEFYTENIYNTTLERYIMLTFTYRLRNFAGRRR